MRKVGIVIALLVTMVLVLGSCAPVPTPAPEPIPTSAPTPEESLEKVRFITKVKNSLPLEQRENLNTYGVYVQSGRYIEPTLPKEGILYMVGGVTLPKLIFLDEDSGETTVVKYEEGDWLKSLDLSFEKAKKFGLRYKLTIEPPLCKHFQLKNPIDLVMLTSISKPGEETN